jgi:hypothetical protein
MEAIPTAISKTTKLVPRHDLLDEGTPNITLSSYSRRSFPLQSTVGFHNYLFEVKLLVLYLGGASYSAPRHDLLDEEMHNITLSSCSRRSFPLQSTVGFHSCLFEAFQDTVLGLYLLGPYSWDKRPLHSTVAPGYYLFEPDEL